MEEIQKTVNGNFDCSYNQLESLKGCPEIVYGDFVCSGNKLTSLKGNLKEVKGIFYCNNNEIKNIREQIIKYGIKAEIYLTDVGKINFSEIKIEQRKFLQSPSFTEGWFFSKKSRNFNTIKW